MSKLNIRLSYKNACILKHALRDKVKSSQGAVDFIYEIIKTDDRQILNKEVWEKQKKELEEEKRALEAII
ncbi:hypothetical protein [Clostridium sp.]|uniref:hypothetical protein n=1 Tax=Clostridium sp. TaxID=1506 RepID=UPI002635A4DD|nr:hypothetical protein [Clostridium sp.]